jgi:hypothetical protein
MADQRTTARPAPGADDAGVGSPRRDPFSYGTSLPQRPNYLPEEEDEANGKRSELWNMLKAVVVATVVIIALGFLLRR